MRTQITINILHWLAYKNPLINGASNYSDTYLKEEKLLTCTTSMRYPERKLLRVLILCSESLVGLESSIASILSIAHALSRGGFSNCDTNITRRNLLKSHWTDEKIWVRKVLYMNEKEIYHTKSFSLVRQQYEGKKFWLEKKMPLDKESSQLTICPSVTFSTIWKTREVSPICDRFEQTTLVTDLNVPRFLISVSLCITGYMFSATGKKKALFRLN